MRHLKMPVVSLCLALSVYACAGNPVRQQHLWNALTQGGYVLLMPPASASYVASDGTVAPPGQCGKRDPLSQQGHVEVERLQQHLTSRAVKVSRVLTSSDCRCVATAGAVFGKAEPWSIIDGVGSDGAQIRQKKITALREAISRWQSEDNLAVVTHRDNIRDAFGVDAQAGQVLVIEPMGDAGYRVLGQLPMN